MLKDMRSIGVFFMASLYVGLPTKSWADYQIRIVNSQTGRIETRYYDDNGNRISPNGQRLNAPSKVQDVATTRQRYTSQLKALDARMDRLVAEERKQAARVNSLARAFETLKANQTKAQVGMDLGRSLGTGTSDRVLDLIERNEADRRRLIAEVNDIQRVERIIKAASEEIQAQRRQIRDELQALDAADAYRR